MQMSEELDKLKSLQEVLAEKYEIEAKVEELPKTLDGSTESLERFKKEYIEKNSEYEAEKAKVAELRTQLDEAQKFREEGEKGMDSITTHREYEILDKQINEAQEKENSIRKELQKEEKVLAELNDILKSEEELIASTEKDVQDSKENLHSLQTKYTAEQKFFSARTAVAFFITKNQKLVHQITLLLTMQAVFLILMMKTSLMKTESSQCQMKMTILQM